MYSLRPLAPRLLAGIGTLTLLAAVGLFASRPAHTTGGPVPVTVANAVQERDSPVRQPVQAGVLLGNAAGEQFTGKFYTVPAGKRLVIEYVTASSLAYVAGYDQNGYRIQIQTGNGNGGVAFFNLVPDAAPAPSVSQVVKLYSDAGTTVRATLDTTGVNYSDVEIGFTGYLVDIP